MLSLNNISKQYADKILYKQASLQIKPGEKIGLVGPNGAGKSTIFKIIMKEESLDEGEVSKPDKMTISYFSQDVGEMSGRSALEEVMSAAARADFLAKQLKQIEIKLEDAANLSDDEMNKLLEEMGDAQLEFDRLGGYDIEVRAKAILTGLGIGEDDYQRPVENFSGGWKMRIALAKVLLVNPDVLLIDEPTNHLDLESVMWLEQWLRDFKGSIVMTSHDREFMNRLVNKVVEVGHGLITTYAGNYDYYETERSIRRSQLEAQFKRQQDMLAKEEEFIAKFAARASHAAQVQSRVKKIDKIDKIELPPEERSIEFTFPVPPRSGNDVVKLQNLSKIWSRDDGKQRVVFQGIDGVVNRGDKIGVVGVNGAGKSTLLKIIAGETEPTTGHSILGSAVQLGYFSQHALDVLNSQNTVYDEVHSLIPLATSGYVRNLLAAFLFRGDDVFKKVSYLSGGEKSRLLLATLMSKPLNFLIFDEPTNHLDILSREVLMTAMQKFEGTIMLVSHDRYFMRSIVNRVFELDKGELRFFKGTYDEYLERWQSR